MKTCITILSILSMMLVASSVNAHDISWILDREKVENNVEYHTHECPWTNFADYGEGKSGKTIYITAHAYGKIGQSMSVDIENEAEFSRDDMYEMMSKQAFEDLCNKLQGQLLKTSDIPIYEDYTIVESSVDNCLCCHFGVM